MEGGFNVSQGGLMPAKNKAQIALIQICAFAPLILLGIKGFNAEIIVQGVDSALSRLELFSQNKIKFQPRSEISSTPI